MKRILIYLILCIIISINSKNSEEFEEWRKGITSFIKEKSSNPSDKTIESVGKTFNKFDSWTECLKNETLSYYLFLIQSKVEYKKKIEIKTYLGVCLRKYIPTELEILNLTYTVLWEGYQLNHSIFLGYDEPFANDGKYPFRAVFFGFILIVYISFSFYVWKNPKTLNFKTNLEMERIQKNIEYDMRTRFIADEDKTKKDFDLTTTLNYSSLYSSQKNPKEDSPMREEDERKMKKFFYREMYNSFNINHNLALVFSPKFCYTPSLNDDNTFHVLSGLRALCFIWILCFTTLPSFFKVPFDDSSVVISEISSIPGQFVFNADFVYNFIFALDGFIVAYTYIKNSKKMNLKYILFEIFGYIFSVYFLIIVAYIFYWQIFIFFSNGPLSSYLYYYESLSCDCQMRNMFLCLANFSFGVYENYFPFCVYHFWAIFSEMQYFIVGIVMIWCYLKFRSLFYTLFVLILFNMYILHITTLGVYPLSTTYLDVLNRNIKNHYAGNGFKLIVRAGPFLYGILFCIFYLSKTYSDGNLVKFAKKYSVFTFIVSSIFFWFGYFMQYLMLNDYFQLNEVGRWIYTLGKHDIISTLFLFMLVSFLSENSPFRRFHRFFNNKFTRVLEKIHFTAYVLMSIVARAVFYSYNEPVKLTKLKLVNYIVGIELTTIFLSFIMTPLFYIPFARIGNLIKSYYIKK